MIGKTSILKTIFLNFYYFPLKVAIHFPLKVAKNTEIISVGERNSIEINSVSQRIGIGFGESFALGGKTGWKISPGGKIVFKGNATFGKGTQIIVGPEGIIEFGDNFYCNANGIINAGKKIIFGNDCLIGWNVEILDGDGHKIISECAKPMYESVEFGNHIWIGSHVMVLKGVKINSDCVIASHSCVTKVFEKKNCIIKDNYIIRENIGWEK